jgi:hypothetical protein
MISNNKKTQSNKLVKQFPARAIAAGFVAVRNSETRQTTKTENILSSFQDFTFLYDDWLVKKQAIHHQKICTLH